MRNFSSAPYLNVLSKLINTVRVTYIDPLILGHHYSWCKGDSDPLMPLKQMTRYLSNNPLLSIENFIIPDGAEDSRTPRTLHRLTYFLGQSLQKFLDKTADRNAPENSPFVN